MEPLTLDEAKRRVSNSVYWSVIAILERAEFEGSFSGNSHHAAQKLAMQAETMVEERWKPKSKALLSTDATRPVEAPGVQPQKKE